MILQALVRLYDDLARQGKIAQDGWSMQKISYALCIGMDGAFQQIVPLVGDDGEIGIMMPVPSTGKSRPGSAPPPQFLWDNSAFLLGVSNKTYKTNYRDKERFEAAKKFHHLLLDSVESAYARAILAFFDSWTQSDASENLEKYGTPSDVTKGDSWIILRVNGQYASEIPEISQAWQKYYDGESNTQLQQCLITGQQAEIMLVHPAIRGIGSKSASALVTFNKDSFCSYGKEQSLNAPVGKAAAFRYTSALNYLLANQNYRYRYGTDTIVCWAEGAEQQYQGFTMAALFGEPAPEGMTDESLQNAVKRLSQGLPVEDFRLDPKRPFYIMCISPNAARLSIRFFIRNSFGDIMKNIQDHQERLRIISDRKDEAADTAIPMWRLLRETVNPNSTDKSASPLLLGAFMRAVFTGSFYPAALLENVMIRIRAESNITRGKAAIIKAYYLKNENIDCPKEVLTVALNKDSTNVPYTLGRLFAVYEKVQEEANPGINATIKDKYFNSAAAIPASIFPVLDNLCQKHLRKLDTGKTIYFDKMIGELKCILGEENPLRLNLPQQGSFVLGYYHQKQSFYTKKEDK